MTSNEPILSTIRRGTASAADPLALLAERWRARAEWLEARAPAGADAYRRAAAELDALHAVGGARDPAQLDLLGEVA